MRICPTCNGRFEDRRLTCPVDRDMLINEGRPDAETGRIFDNRYRLGNCIGVGGMGIVYEATRLELSETVAIKIMKLEGFRSEEQKETAEKRFHREAEAAGSLDSPGIIKTFDCRVSQDGRTYMVLERLRGATFDELRRAGKFVAVENVVALLREVCDILALAHDKGIVHRDLKPSNLFLHRVDKDHSQVKILDFGIAKFLDRTGERLTTTGEFIGTLPYMAPEQAKAQPVTKALDVYALGVILFESLTGRLPLELHNPLEFLRICASLPAPSLRTLRPDISTELDEVVSRCLLKKPQQRYAHARELGAALAAIKSLRCLDESLGRTSTLQVNPSQWVGRIIDDRYELQEWVAHARFGSDVYKAIHVRTDATVAVRLWRTGRGPVRDCLLEVFRREAKAMGVRHPNVITILDLGYNDDCVYIVTDLVESVSLRQLLLRKAPLAYGVAYILARGAADGLGALHAKGIVSGGLSPETIRVISGSSGPERMQITPFGLKNLTQINLLFQQFGRFDADDHSLYYISPEQRKGFEPDARSDIYSLGLILLEMLGGRCEVPGSPEARTATEPRPDDKASRAFAGNVAKWILPPDLSPALREFLARVMDEEPQRRFAGAAEFVEALPKP